MNGNLDYSWFRLFSIKGFGAVTVNRLAARANANGLTVEQIFDLDADKFQSMFPPKGGELFIRLHEDDAHIYAEYNRLIGDKVAIIHPEHPLYPLKLRTLYLDQAPALIFAKGLSDLLKEPGIAIVGSREADQTALDFSMRSAGLAVSCGFNVVSGYARGVDTLAHYGAVKTGGTTTFVLSYGLDHFKFKSCFEGLAPEKNSLTISQFYPREVWNNNNGMIRNRLVIGLSSAVVIIAAEEKSGTINTGNLALKAGIPLFVVSPKLYSNPPQGNISLIEQGAVEIEALPQLQEHLNALNLTAPSANIDKKNLQVNLPL